MRTYEELDPEQLEEIRWLTHRTESIFVMPVGFGKTVCVLTAFLNQRKMLGDLSMLVVSTTHICNLTWEKEISGWEHLTGQFTYQSIAGKVPRSKDFVSGSLTLAAKIAEFDSADILAINFESLENYYNLIDEGLVKQRDVLVIDEVDKMSRYEAARTKRHVGGAKKIKAKPAKGNRKAVRAHTHRFGGYVQRFSKRIAMTATPCAESYEGFWAIEACVSTKRRLEENPTWFRKKYGMPDWNGFGTKWTYDLPMQQLAIEEAIAPITHISMRAEYMDLPDPIHRCIEVPWTKKARAEYDELEKKLEVLLDRDTNKDLSLDELEIAVDGKGALHNKLRQVCSGFAYDEDRNPVFTSDPDAKLVALDSLRDSLGPTPLLVFTQFVAEAESIKRRYPDATIGMPDSLEDWNRGRLPLLCVHPASCSHGLNLQYGTFVCAFYSNPLAFSHWFQGWGRVHRRGQTRQVSVLRFERPNSVDQDVYEGMMAKDSRLSGFTDRMRARRARTSVTGG